MYVFSRMWYPIGRDRATADVYRWIEREIESPAG